MSKNIIIQEGGINHQFTAAKLKTNMVGGGTCLWVPEDGVNLGTKSITENGTYTAAADNLYGFSQVTVNVAGGQNSADDDGLPTPDITPSGGPGHSIIGTDPDDGEPVVVGVDKDGNIVTTPIPAGIDIIVPPIKTSYTDGEDIDFTGIVVALKKRDGTDFTNSTYPTGRAPYASLIFPVRQAHGSESGGIDGHSFSIDFDYGVYDKRTDIILAIQSDAPQGTTYSDGKLQFIKVTGEYWEIYYDGTLIHSGGSSAGIITEVYWARNPNNNTANLGYFYTGAQSGTAVGFATPIDISSEDATIPVQWQSPYDGNTYEDTFNISVTGGDTSGTTSGGEHDSSGSSGNF